MEAPPKLFYILRKTGKPPRAGSSTIAFFIGKRFMGVVVAKHPTGVYLQGKRVQGGSFLLSFFLSKRK